MTISEVFLFAFDAVMPIVLLILFGWVLRRIKFINDSFLQTANKLVFRILLPLLLFYNVYNIKDLGEIQWSSVLFAVAVIVLLFVAGLICCNLLTRDRRQKGVLWQAFYRSNFAIIGIPLAGALGGDEGVAVASILSAFSIPLFNALAVISLSVYTASEDKNKIDIKEILLKIIKNPLIIGVALGFVVLGVRKLIPVDSDNVSVFTIRNNLPFVYETLGMIAGITSPLALIVLGGRFRFSAISRMKLQVAGGTVARIIFAPLAGIALCYSAEKAGFAVFSAGHYAAFLALFGSPVAVSSAIMASQMDNDAELADQILVWTSVFSILTVFCFVVILKNIGLI